MTTDIDRALAKMSALGIIEPEARPQAVRDLEVAQARSLEGIEQCTSLESLRILGCSIADYSPLARLGALRLLTVENCDLADTAWAAGLQLKVAVLRRNRVRDGRPVVTISTLHVLDLSGNPLDHQSREAAVAHAGSRLLTLDDEETAELNVLLADARTGIVSYRSGDSLWACATGLDLVPHPEAGHVLTSPEELRDMARGNISPGEFLGLDASNNMGGGR
ncbi:leucine-rich repeat domain-containing protein [Kocuria rosea]|uniref:Uncharacterized protein n=1 Tax=Kocuria rosea subsp. polaris TaxID=136273 RepID=A0A0A6VQJ4_KOCRO|nr:hypothetical protein [Kocuria polaris]KHD96658.1 hypothetical protein GY22_14485 [Kocuria polaris]